MPLHKQISFAMETFKTISFQGLQFKSKLMTFMSLIQIAGTQIVLVNIKLKINGPIQELNVLN